MRVLLVEDDPHTAAFIGKGLREDGHIVEHAGDGRTGLFLATTETFDAIVLGLPSAPEAKASGDVLVATVRQKTKRARALDSLASFSRAVPVELLRVDREGCHRH